MQYQQQQEVGRKQGREMEGEGEEMKSMITQQVSLRDLHLHHHHHHNHHGQNGHFHESQNSGPHPQDDDFMEQMLSTINPTDCANAWPSTNPLLPTLPLTLSTSDVVLPPSKGQGGEDVGHVPALFSGFVGSLHGNAQPPSHLHQPQHFHHPSQDQGGIGKKYGGQTRAMMNTDQVQAAPPTSASTGGSTGTAPLRQRVRARRGQATDPHSIAERLRRERIAERMKALQELVPNANKTDKASMLDEIIDYVKFLQLQVKVLSMSRLGGAGAVAPLGADMSSEGGLGRKSNVNGGNGSAKNENMTMTEHQVAKLMEEDMGSAMQYLQGKGLCLMPISLATAISTATARNPLSSPPTRLPLNTNANSNNTNANANAQLNLVRVGVQSNMNVNMSSSASPDHNLPSVKDNGNVSSSTAKP